MTAPKPKPATPNTINRFGHKRVESENSRKKAPPPPAPKTVPDEVAASTPRSADRIKRERRLPPERYGIYRAKTTGRLDAPGDNWSWRVMITRDGKSMCNKSFADSKYGGEPQALQAAVDYRDRFLARCEPTQKRDRHQMLRRNNTTGLPGVCRCVSKGRDYYVAQTLLPDGTRLRRAYSIAKYGEQEARRLAIAERQQQLATVDGEPASGTAPQPPDR